MANSKEHTVYQSPLESWEAAEISLSHSARVMGWDVCGDGSQGSSLGKGQLSSQRTASETLLCMPRHQGSGSGCETTWPVTPTRANASCLCQHTQRIKLIIAGKTGGAEEPAQASPVANKTPYATSYTNAPLLSSGGLAGISSLGALISSLRASVETCPETEVALWCGEGPMCD